MKLDHDEDRSGELERHASDGMPGFLVTKLEPPQARAEHIRRTSLLMQLSAAPQPKLTVVAAPAGHGKTTLLAQLIGDAGAGAMAYLSLDEDDSDPTQFWLGVSSALGACRPRSFSRSIQLARRGANPLTTLIPGLIEEALPVDPSVTLVLDDYHRIGRSDVHAQVERLVERLPAQLRLVVATRADPPLPLGRLRAAAELSEIRAADLRFDDAEAEALLNAKLGLELDTDEIRTLAERTEGWAAALYLAALSLAPCEDRRSFIASFAGTNRFIVDYLGAEILARLLPEHRDFLVRSSIVDSLTGSLVDAMLERTGSAAVLHELERANLFLVPLDEERRWYRFHHLFGDLLRGELAEAQPAIVPDLNSRASAWFAKNGSTDQAVAHALAAGDDSATADLIAAHYWAYLHRGRVSSVDRWLRALSASSVESDPRLCLAAAWVAGYRGRPADVEGWLTRAAAAEAEGGPSPEGPGSVEAVTALVRAGFTLGDVSVQVRAGRTAVAYEFANETWNWIARGCLAIGLFFAGELAEARRHLERALALIDEDELPQAGVAARSYLALIELDGKADDARAEALIGQAFALVSEHRLEEEHDTAIANLARGRLLARRGAFDQAEAQFEHAVGLLLRGSNVLETAFAELELARVNELLENRAAARAVFEEAKARLASCPDPGILADRLSATRERLGMIDPLQPDADARAGLTERELEVLAYLPGQLSQREIGSVLYISFNTVTSHMKSIFRKLGVSSRREAVKRARELNIV